MYELFLEKALKGPATSHVFFLFEIREVWNNGGSTKMANEIYAQLCIFNWAVQKKGNAICLDFIFTYFLIYAKERNSNLC